MAMPRVSAARERLLETASAIFYAEGIHSVGVDRLVAEAGVTRATFYRHFPSKEDLVLAYIEREDAVIRDAVATAQASGADPQTLLRLLVEHLCGLLTGPDFRGCPFINAAAEYANAEDPIRVAIDAHRVWFVKTMRTLFAAAGHPHPTEAARQLFMMRDGAMVAAYLGKPKQAVADLESAVDRLFS